jgi:hypothetical protein
MAAEVSTANPNLESQEAILILELWKSLLNTSEEEGEDEEKSQ